MSEPDGISSISLSQADVNDILEVVQAMAESDTKEERLNGQRTIKEILACKPVRITPMLFPDEPEFNQIVAEVDPKWQREFVSWCRIGRASGEFIDLLESDSWLDEAVERACSALGYD